jgi:TolA-binding protein
MKKYLLLAIVLFVFIGCKPTKESRLEEINKLEKQTLIDAKAISQSRADSLLNMYDSFIEDFPKDTNAMTILYNAADICANVKYCDRAISYLERLIDDFPSSQIAELAKFKMGVVYEQACNNKEKAKEAYILFKKEYPNSSMSNDADIMLYMLEMSDETEIIREFEAKNTETPTTEN